MQLSASNGVGEEITLGNGPRWELNEFRRLLDALPAGAYTCDPEGLITYYNRSAVSLWGRAPRLNDPIDRFCGSFKLFSQDGQPIRHEQCWMALALLRNQAYNAQEIVVQRPNGERLTVLAFANPFLDESGRLAGAVNVLVDISDRKRAEEALREADRAKDEFLATLAHELRNPLAPLRNAVQILRMQASVSPQSQWAQDVIDRQIHQMTRLIDDLLDVSRITRNKLELRRERIELTEVVRVAVETSRPLIDAGKHELLVTLPAQPIALDADLTRLAQSISNLLNNAAKYTEPGGHISLAAERQGSDVLITVKDNGIGIPPEMIPRIFEMFTQVERAVSRSQGGLGIGLTLVKRLIEMHGGSIRAHSDGVSRGSEFQIRLPVAIEATASLSGSDLRGDTRRTNPSLRILIADDNQDAAVSLGMLCQLTGNQVRTAFDGEEALDVARQFHPDVIILDIGMPKLSGYECARRLREEPWGRSVVLIAVTGWGQDDDRCRSKAAGFDHHLVKPIEMSALNKLLEPLAHQVATRV